jgi:hypothetical protein
MDKIEEGLKDGKLECRKGNFYGKEYRKLLRQQIKTFVEEITAKNILYQGKLMSGMYKQGNIFVLLSALPQTVSLSVPFAGSLSGVYGMGYPRE